MITALELWDKLRQQPHSWIPTGQVFAFVLTPEERLTVLNALCGPQSKEGLGMDIWPLLHTRCLTCGNEVSVLEEPDADD